MQDVAEEDSYQIDEIPSLRPIVAESLELGLQPVLIENPANTDDSGKKDRLKPELQPSDHAPIIVDVGGHIGCFPKRVHQRNPNTKIFAIECCPENLPVLRKNVGDFATVIPAAVTYESNLTNSRSRLAISGESIIRINARP